MAELDLDNFCSPWISAKDEGWAKILNLGVKKYFAQGSIIIGNGQKVDDLYYLHSGTVKLMHIAKDGREKILLYIEKGNIFGEVPFFDRKPCYKQFTAVETCAVYTFSRETFYKRIVPQFPELLVNLMEVLVNKARTICVQASDFDSIVTRLCKMLIYVTERDSEKALDGKLLSSKGVSKEELACILGIHRTTLFAAIAQLKHEGILEDISKKRLLINDYERLVKIAEG